jgi:flagellar motor switch/type III secretory pathway protein FliN
VNAAARAKPFPWHALERKTRLETDALRDVRRWAAAHADLPRLASVLGELLDAEVEVLVKGAQPLSAARGIPGGAAVLVARADAPQLERAMLVEADVALVATAVARAAKRRPPAVLQAGTTASPQAAGGLAAIVVAALRRAHHGLAMRALAAGPAEALETDMTRLGQELLAVTLTVLVAHDAHEARIVVARSAVLAAEPAPWNGAALAALGAMPVSVPIVAHALRATATDVASLEPGDACMLEGWPLTRSPAGGLAGPVRLAAPDGWTGVAAELHEDGRVVLRGEVVPLCAAEAEMGETVVEGGLIEAIGEVPVVVRVEIGEARMAAREWAALARGDVVALGRRVGEAVVLRVGGIPVARGDLVEIDGEVGVRIIERLGEDAAKR